MPRNMPTTDPLPPVNKTPPHNHRNDGVEDMGLACRDLRRVIQDGLAQAHKSRADTAAHEQDDRQAFCWNAFVAGRNLIATHRENPVAVLGIVQDEPKQGSSSDPPEDGDLIAAADEVAQKKLGLWAALMATLVVPVNKTDRPNVRPATANNVPSVTINDGTTVRTTKTPLINPTSAPSAKAANMPSQIGPS